MRAYERRGPTWSDVVLLDLETLVERLEEGKRFYVGKRHEFQASEFDLGDAIRLRKRKSGSVIIVGNKNKAERSVFDAFPRL